MINWKKIKFTFEPPVCNRQRVNAHILFTAGVSYDTTCFSAAMDQHIHKAVMERLVQELFHGVFGDVRKHLAVIYHKMLMSSYTGAQMDEVEKLFKPLHDLMTPPKLDEILREGTTRDGRGGTVIPSATPNPNPFTTLIHKAREVQPIRQAAPSGSEIESYVETGRQ